MSEQRVYDRLLRQRTDGFPKRAVPSPYAVVLQQIGDSLLARTTTGWACWTELLRTAEEVGAEIEDQSRSNALSLHVILPPGAHVHAQFDWSSYSEGRSRAFTKRRVGPIGVHITWDEQVDPPWTENLVVTPNHWKGFPVDGHMGDLWYVESMFGDDGPWSLSDTGWTTEAIGWDGALWFYRHVEGIIANTQRILRDAKQQLRDPVAWEQQQQQQRRELADEETGIGVFADRRQRA
jgi:hypothetical protein